MERFHEAKNCLREKLQGYLGPQEIFQSLRCTTPTRLEAVYSHSLVINLYFLIFYWLFLKISENSQLNVTRPRSSHTLWQTVYSDWSSIHNLNGAYNSCKIIFIICSLISPFLFQAIENLYVWPISIGFRQIKCPNVLEILIFTSMSCVIQIYIPALFCFKSSTHLDLEDTPGQDVTSINYS